MSKKEELIKGLNEDLAAELGTIIRYTYQAGHSFGVMGIEMREMFEEEREDELGHASYLTDIIVDLGGEPTTTPMTFDKPDTLKKMLEVDIKMEEADVVNYMAHAALADELDMVDVKMRLEEMAADEAGHARELRRILKGL